MKFFMVAGETSGDVHGANLALELFKLYPDAVFSGTGGENLARLGQKQLFDTRQMAIIGFDGVLKKLPFIFRMFSSVEKAVREEKPDAVILVDYPGFNLRLAKKLKKYGIPVVYFVAPQFWVWNYKRIHILRDYCDLTLSIFPFETAALEKEGVNSVYIGNPAADNMRFRYDSKEEFLKDCGLSGARPVLAILPGSREKEIKSLLPAFAEAARGYSNRYDFVTSVAPGASEELISGILAGTGIKFLKDAQYDVIKYSEFVWACSGTVTLETAILKKPMIIVYRSSAFNIAVAKKLSRLRTVGLPNIVAGRGFLPEIVGSSVKSEDIIESTERALKNAGEIRSELEKISEQFSGRSACVLAAREIYSLLEKRRLSSSTLSR